MKSSSQHHLFQSEPEPELFGERSDTYGPADQQKIRLHLVELLETARKAKTMP